MKILLVEDDERISNFLLKGLEEVNHFVVLCKSAEEVLEIYTSEIFDIIICDIMLPKLSGIQLVQILRYKQVKTPILIISALNAIDDKVTALDSGADDYMTKPFHYKELLSRINALTRRFDYAQKVNNDNIINLQHLTVDFDKYEVYQNGELIELSPREFRLLSYLIENKNKAVTRAQILKAVWDINFNNHTNVVDVYISYLRNKIDKDSKFIVTIKGIGYLFKTE